MRFSDLFKGKDAVDLTNDDIGKSLFYLSLPIVIINLLQTAYNLVDTFWLGQYSKEALAAITFGFPLVFLLISLGMGLAVAGSVLFKTGKWETTMLPDQHQEMADVSEGLSSTMED